MNETLRTILIGTITTIAVVVLLKAQEPSGQSGRFQLITGTFTIEFKNGTSAQQATAFKIDTATGQASLFRTGIDKDGKGYMYWQSIQQQ